MSLLRRPRGAHQNEIRVAPLLVGLTAVAAGTPGFGRVLLAQQGPVGAARLSGVVGDSTSGAALGGAAVLLRDSLDHTVGQTVSDERGRYALPLAAAARCPRDANTAAALGLLDPVRGGLLATVIASAQQPSTLTVLRFEREFAPGEADADAPDGHASKCSRTPRTSACTGCAGRTGSS